MTILDIKKDFGAVGDGVTDDSAAFLKAISRAKAGGSWLPNRVLSDPAGSVSVFVPAGNYLLTQDNALMGREGMSSKIFGLTFTGEGPTLSNIIFKPATAGVLAKNDYWLGLKFENLSFYSATPGSTFMLSSTTHNAQRYNFTNVSFNGFKYGLHLLGDNNNSEFYFNNCHTSGFESNGAFLYVPDQGASDQFLNYWFYGCTHWSTSAPFINMARGGSVHIFGLDVSDYAANNTEQKFLFYLRGTNHALGVCNFYAEGVRVESKSPKGGLIHSEWPQGQVTFQNADYSSQAYAVNYEDIISIAYVNTDGATYAFKNSILAGSVKVSFAINDWSRLHDIVFDRCTWLQKTRPTDVVRYSSNGNDLSQPIVDFIECRNGSYDPFNANGVSVWDARVGYKGQLVQSLTKRYLSVRSVNGLPTTGETLKINLPVGATITGMHVFSPAGAVTEGDGGSWALFAGQTRVGGVLVSGAMSAGFNQRVDLPVPFVCSTATTAKLTIIPSNVSQSNKQAMLIIEGYW